MCDNETQIIHKFEKKNYVYNLRLSNDLYLNELLDNKRKKNEQIVKY